MNSTNGESTATKGQLNKVEAEILAAMDSAPDVALSATELAQLITSALAEAGMLAGFAEHFQEEWAAVVGWRNEHGQTEQNRGYGATREAALADARSQPRMLGLGDEDEVAYKAVRRFVSPWEES